MRGGGGIVQGYEWWRRGRYSIPASSISRTPMLGHNPSDWTTFAVNSENNAFAIRCRPANYHSALGHVLRHFATHSMPSTLCPNCFTHHLPNPCRLPQNDFTQHLLTDHPICASCYQRHPPPYPCLASLPAPIPASATIPAPAVPAAEEPDPYAEEAAAGAAAVKPDPAI